MDQSVNVHPGTILALSRYQRMMGPNGHAASTPKAGFEPRNAACGGHGLDAVKAQEIFEMTQGTPSVLSCEHRWPTVPNVP